MSNSQLVKHTHLSPYTSGKRKYNISRITIHCYVGQCKMKDAGAFFSNPRYKVSCNYCVATDGICLIADESVRSWCSSSSDNDNRSITIEVASDKYHPYRVKDDVYNNLINLLIDICKRNNKKRLVWINDKTQALCYKTKDDELLLTVHKWFKNKECPGEFLLSKHNEIVEKVNKALNAGECDEMGCPYWKNGKCTKDVKVETPAKKSNEEIAKEVIKGNWGNGTDRKNRLESAGYNYREIQNIVNKMLK